MNKLSEPIQINDDIEPVIQEYDWNQVSHQDQIRQQVIISNYDDEDIIESLVNETVKIYQ